jgi:hypothetical protein
MSSAFRPKRSNDDREAAEGQHHPTFLLMAEKPHCLPPSEPELL